MIVIESMLQIDQTESRALHFRETKMILHSPFAAVENNEECIPCYCFKYVENFLNFKKTFTLLTMKNQWTYGPT